MNFKKQKVGGEEVAPTDFHIPSKGRGGGGDSTGN